VPSSINVTVENITVGENAVINIETPTDLLGNVTVNVDGDNYTVPVSGGKGTLVLDNLDVGPHTVDVIFDGSDKYEPTSNSTTFNVDKVEFSGDDIKVIDQGNGTVVVIVPDNATGNITVKVGNNTYTAPINNGTATIDLNNETPGHKEIEIIYSGDDNHDNATTTSSVTIPKLDAPISISVEDILVGDKAIVNVTLPDDATGNVTIEIDGKKYTAPVIDGIATFELDN
jgi:virulence-associated protein VagC